jgi:hypothetical protein
LSSFTALLAGDAEAIRRNFEVALWQENESWRLKLAPHDARARRRVQEIVIAGSEDAPRCFTIINVDGGASVMLLGEAAANDVAADISLEALQARCLSGPGPRGSGLRSEEKHEGRSGPSPKPEVPNPRP